MEKYLLVVIILQHLKILTLIIQTCSKNKSERKRKHLFQRLPVLGNGPILLFIRIHQDLSG